MSFGRIGYARSSGHWHRENAMGKSFESVVTSYLKARSLSPATGVEYRSTLSKWSKWGKEVPLESIGRADVREFLDWVHERAIDNEGTNPGRTCQQVPRAS
jgi:site-specific recombinase XerD